MEATLKKFQNEIKKNIKFYNGSILAFESRREILIKNNPETNKEKIYRGEDLFENLIAENHHGLIRSYGKSFQKTLRELVLIRCTSSLEVFMV